VKIIVMYCSDIYSEPVQMHPYCHRKW